MGEMRLRAALQCRGAAHRFPFKFAPQFRGAFYCQKEYPMDPAALGQFLPLILIFGIMYFLLIRPQQKKVKEHQKMIDQLRVRDQVVTQGGMIGKVSKVKEDGEVEVEIADGVKVRIVKATIAQVLNKTEPAS